MIGGKGLKNTIVTLDATDRRIEQGLAYQAIAHDEAVPATGNLTLLIQTPPSKPFVFTSWQFYYSSGCTIEAYEDVVVSDPGTPITPVNFNRVPHPVTGIRPSKSIFSQNPIITSPGTPLIPTIELPGGEKGGDTDGGTEETLFYILRPEANYTATLTNISNTDSRFTMVALYVEAEGPLSSGT